MMDSTYTGRFAPSPTGPLHAGSLASALASWLDARAHGGRWLVRIEDIDPPRCPPGTDDLILRQLAALHLHADAPVQKQSSRYALYDQALGQLQQAGWVYPCGCTRRDIEAAHAALGLAHHKHGERPYPGTCRHGLHGKPARAWRLATDTVQQHFLAKQAASAQPERATSPVLIANQWHWHDRILGAQQQDVAASVGDFAVRRGDGLWAYQLAVVVDDADQGITDVVRGADLADNTPRQILLQRALGLPTPRYMHTPLVLQADGEKLSKQYGAPSIDTSSDAHSLSALRQAGEFLGLEHRASDGIDQTLQHWIPQWAARVDALRRGLP